MVESSTEDFVPLGMQRWKRGDQRVKRAIGAPSILAIGRRKSRMKVSQFLIMASKNRCSLTWEF